MATDIFYFTGTGNSLNFARRISAGIDGSKIISIAQAVKKATITSRGSLGIVCPVYMHNLPLLVVDFIKKITQPDYFFIIFTGGGELGNCLKYTRKLLTSRQLKLSAVFSLQMPSNYTPYGCPSETEQQQYFAAAEKRTEEIVNIITSKKEYAEKRGTGFFRSNIHPGLFYKMGYKYINYMAKSFYADENCSSCGICEKVCPVGNVRLTDGKPVWNRHCQQCWACLQWCPQQAVQFGKKTAGINRYHNPYVTVNDIINASPSGKNRVS